MCKSEEEQLIFGHYYHCLTLSGLGGGADSAPLRFFLHNSKTPGDIEKNLSAFNFTPLTDILLIFNLHNSR